MTYELAINTLKNSLIYAMSLGSKELYHSNVWAWLMENDSSFIKVFVDDFNFNEFEVIKVEREKLNRDIVIFIKNKEGKESHIVIENKIKSIPTYKQLEEYTNGIDKTPFKYEILTGIGEKCSLNLDLNNKLKGKWNYINYSTIANRIREISNNSINEVIKEKTTQIQEYCDVIEAINYLLSESLKKVEGKLDYQCSIPAELRITDVFKKLKGSEFCSIVEKEILYFNSLLPKGYRVYVNQSFNRTKVTLDFRFTNGNEKYDNAYTTIGVQIEGDTFRIMVENNPNKDPNFKTPYKLYEYYAKEDIGWFDNKFDQSTNRTIFGHPTRLTKEFNSYSNRFVYQYFNIDDSNNSYDKLINLIIEYLEKSLNILKESTK